MDTTSAAPAPHPSQVMLDMMNGKWVSMAIGAAADLGVADHMTDGPSTAEDLAKKVGAHAPSLNRLLRALASAGVFEEVREGVFALNALSETLRTGVPGSMRDTARFYTSPWTWRAWGELTHSVRTGETGIQSAFGMSAWDYLHTHPEEAAIFNGAMSVLSRLESTAVAETFDFSRFRRLADIAGGHGVLLSTVMKRFPHIGGILFDMPSVCEGSREALAAEGLGARCEVVPGDFFQSIPRGADAYMMKHIIHDWDDEKSIAILRNIRAAMDENGTLLVIEIVVPGPGVRSFAKLLDLEMLAIAGGLERTESEYRALFAAADFELVAVHPTPSPVSVLEARPRK